MPAPAISIPPWTFGVDYNRVYKFQNILFASNIGEWIIMHGFSKVYGIQNFYLVLSPFKHFSALYQYRSFRKRFVNTENDNSLKNELFLWCTALEIACCHFLTD